jgi:TonB family protein
VIVQRSITFLICCGNVWFAWLGLSQCLTVLIIDRHCKLVHIRIADTHQINMTSKLHIGLATIVAISIGSAHAQQSVRYVPAKAIPCQYGLPPSALQKLPPQSMRSAVRVSLNAQGKVEDAVLEQSSGDVTFDRLAIREARMADCKPFLDVDGNAIPVETNLLFAVTSAEFRPDVSSETFAAKVERLVRAKIVWDGQTNHLRTTISVRCSSDGKLLSAAIVRSSGNPEWDAVALSAVQHSDPMPLDSDGKTPKNFKVTVQPGPA